MYFRWFFESRFVVFTFFFSLFTLLYSSPSTYFDVTCLLLGLKVLNGMKMMLRKCWFEKLYKLTPRKFSLKNCFFFFQLFYFLLFFLHTHTHTKLRSSQKSSLKLCKCFVVWFCSEMCTRIQMNTERKFVHSSCVSK